MARTPFARLSDCATELEQLGIPTRVDPDDEVLFRLEPEAVAEATPYEPLEAQGFVREKAVEAHNLHFFTHDGQWVVSTVPEEDAQGRLN